MPGWIEELEELVKGMGSKAGANDDERDDYDDEIDDEDEEEDETPAPPKRARKATGSGACDPKPNAETTNHGEGAAVHDPKSLDRASGGGPVAMRKGIEDVVSDETVDALEVSAVLGDLAKGINTLVAGVPSTEAFAVLTERVAGLEKGLAAIGKGLTAALTQQTGMVKSLHADVEEIGRQPRGRKSVLKSVERKFAGNESAGPEIPTAAQLLEKSMTALKKGLISAHDAAALEAARNRGEWARVKDLWDRVNG